VVGIIKTWFFRIIFFNFSLAKSKKYSIILVEVDFGGFVIMKYEQKTCNICGERFDPTSPNQKYCINCKDEGRKIVDRIRDRKRCRNKYRYKEYIRYCKACGKKFTTYYNKKKYCGSEECEKIRLQRKNYRIQSKRNIESERIRSKKYYNNNKEICRYRAGLRYREKHSTDISYTPRGIFKHTIKSVGEYVNMFGYELISETYKDNKSHILLMCPNGHKWKTNFHNFKDNGARCLHCYLENNYTSKPEQKLVDYFVENYPDTKFIHNDRTQIPPLELDLYFPDYKLGVEVCGLYWHSEISGGKKKSYHYDKMIKCYDKNIRLITIFEDEIRDKFDVVISRILQALNLTSSKIYARKCEVKELDSKLANKFFENNHIQGASGSKKRWGLFYKDELIQVLTVGSISRMHAGKLKYNPDARILELKRFASLLGVSIVGGAGKLFSRAKKYALDEGFTHIKSYCDTRYSNPFNPVYEILGFKKISYTKYTPHYIKGGMRYRNQGLRKTPEERLTGLTEWELRQAQGYDRIWDTGHITYLYEITKK